MPPIIHMVHADQKQSFEKVLSVPGFVAKTNLSFHDFTASAP